MTNFTTSVYCTTGNGTCKCVSVPNCCGPKRAKRNTVTDQTMIFSLCGRGVGGVRKLSLSGNCNILISGCGSNLTVTGTSAAAGNVCCLGPRASGVGPVPVVAAVKGPVTVR